jgi:hypothetical protein
MKKIKIFKIIVFILFQQKKYKSSMIKQKIAIPSSHDSYIFDLITFKL